MKPDNKGHTLFDEVALMNDINAACAAAMSIEQTRTQSTPASTIEERLAILTSLHTRGLIDEADLIRRKKEILDGI